MIEIATWIDAVKFLSTVGEIAKFPYIGGVATCVITLLETIQAAAQNDEDLQELMKSTKATMDIVMKTVKAHNDSAPHFHDVCGELKKYLNEVLDEMEEMHLKKSCALKRYFKAKSVSVTIAGFKQRVQNIKEDFMIRVMTDSRLAIANLEDRLTSLEDKLNANTVTLVDAIRTSRRNIQKEMHALRTSQNKRMDAILSAIIFELQARCSYQELPGDLCTIMERFKPLKKHRNPRIIHCQEQIRVKPQFQFRNGVMISIDIYPTVHHSGINP
ncbi:hypothetical protein EDD85DRAFT_849111 [Armillaria nabsnona]|nr:hypothetical protein EDD85DRAFT_849111 [Armillaria nabsnona]